MAGGILQKMTVEFVHIAQEEGKRDRKREE